MIVLAYMFNVFKTTTDFCLASRNKKFHDYIATRNWTDETIQQFKIGYFPPSLLSLKVKVTNDGGEYEDLIEGGIVKDSWSIFSDRIIFPIWDQWGEEIAITGRVLDEKKKPKYFNTFYEKGKTLYGLNFAIDEIVRTKRVYVWEGNADVVTSHQFGLKNAVGCQGTAFSEDHFILLSRYAEEIILVFDNDNGGKKALYSFNKRKIEEDKKETRVYRCMFKNHKDADEFLNKEGKDRLIDYMNNQINSSTTQYRLKNIQAVQNNGKKIPVR